MAGEWSATTLAATYKEVYADDIRYLLGKRYVLLNNVKFAASQKPGKTYHEPVVLTRDGFFEYRSANSGTITYGNPVPADIEDAQLNSSQMFGRSRIDTEACARGASSKYAFRSSIGVSVESLWDTSNARIESDLWSGGIDIGVLDVVGSPANTASITLDSWAVGNFVGCEGTKIQILTTDLKTDRGAADSSKLVKITAVDIPNRKLTLATSTDEVTWTAGYPASTQSGDRVFYASQIVAGNPATVRTMTGLHSILGTTSGTILNISTTMSLWVASQVNVNGLLSLSTIADGIQQAYGKGLDEDISVICSPSAWTKLAIEWTALKRGDVSKKTNYSMGAGDMEISVLGINAKIEASPFCRSGKAVGIPYSYAKRIGASELTDQIPGRGGDYFSPVPGTNALEFQTYSNQALFVIPGKCINYYGITG